MVDFKQVGLHIEKGRARCFIYYFLTTVRRLWDRLDASFVRSSMKNSVSGYLLKAIIQDVSGKYKNPQLLQGASWHGYQETD